MENPQLAANARELQRQLAWLHQYISTMVRYYFRHEVEPMQLADLPSLEEADAPYTQAVQELDLSPAERLVLNLALAPSMQPAILDTFLLKNESTGQPYTEFGGIKGKMHNGFLPTVQTALYLLAGTDVTSSLPYQAIFQSEHIFSKKQILQLTKAPADEPWTSSGLAISRPWLQRLTTGGAYQQSYSSEFPAAPLTTALEWQDLVLDPVTMNQVEEINAWMQHERLIMQDWNLGRLLKRGYRVLFYGPPGTGKTLTASLIGKQNGMEVYRVDLSQIVSKYIGETEKNLARVFDLAEGRRWVLFFDEADALFGQRTANQSSNDRHSNQEIAYLLQRIEDFPGLIILATNLRGNIDAAFSRRFQAMINFRMPTAEQRLQLWQNAFAEHPKLDESVDLHQIAEDYEMAGGSIINVLRYVALAVAREGIAAAMPHHLLEGIRREQRKMGKMV